MPSCNIIRQAIEPSCHLAIMRSCDDAIMPGELKGPPPSSSPAPIFFMIIAIIVMVIDNNNNHHCIIIIIIIVSGKKEPNENRKM